MDVDGRQEDGVEDGVEVREKSINSRQISGEAIVVYK